MKTALVGIAVWGLAAAVCAQEAEGSGKEAEGSGKRMESPPPSVGKRAQDPTSPGERKEWRRPEPPRPEAGPFVVTGEGPPALAGGGAPPAAGPLKGARALSTRAGEAVLRFPDGERTLRPGDHLGDDVVRAVDTGLLVLDRPSSRPGGAATVVVRFDGAGLPRVRVYHVEDPTPVNPPAVR